MRLEQARPTGIALAAANSSGALDMWSQLSRFGRNSSGNVAIIFGIALVPIMLAVGVAVDFSRVAAAHTAAQNAADAAALAIASLPIGSDAEMESVARKYVNSNDAHTLAASAGLTEFDYDPLTRRVKLVVSGSLDTEFLGVVGIKQINYHATSTAVRATRGSVELAMVLDNTWSMNGEKLDALKSASIQLVDMLKQDPNANVKIGLVPYADYVNVGTDNRYADWVSVPSDYSVTSQRVCHTYTTRTTCQRSGPTRYCTRYTDGVPETYNCTPSICTKIDVAPYESCSGGGTTHYTWFGCVGSRTKGNLRLTDAEPATPYPGYLATRQNCLNPIVPLTDSKSTIITALQNMIVNVGGYKPETYIPGGLIWGVNILSPTAPFSQGAAYDKKNLQPRKVLMLMTDGANTLRLNPSNGQHIPPNSPSQLDKTYRDQQAICDYAKSLNIEVFTVAFGVGTDAVSKAAMKSCATDAAHYFDAADRSELMAAFQNIAQNLSNVRLAR